MDCLTHHDFKKMMLASYERIEKEKEEINKINVFPVPDKDTGSNLAKTLQGIKSAIENNEFKDISELAEKILDGALTGAQGNAGVIYTGFLAGFLPELTKNPINTRALSLAFKGGAQRARESIQDPKEGTILDVIDEAAITFREEAEKEKDILNIFKSSIERAKTALLQTREKLEVLKKANVVDAGGLGFLVILESYLEALKPLSVEIAEDNSAKSSEEVRQTIGALSQRYEVVSLLENPKADDKTLRERLKNLGNSLDAVQIGNRLKLHFHTDFPEEVKKIMEESGKILEFKTEDMVEELAAQGAEKPISIGIVTEDIGSLLPKIIERYQIELAPVILDWPDLEGIPGENIYQKMREIEKRGIKTFPKTSQATPKSYLDAFKKQLARFGKVLCLTVTSKISGCYNSAVQAKQMLDEKERERVFLLDSLSLLSGQALLILRAIELSQEGKEINEILEELKKLIPQVGLYILFEDPKWIESLGRITKSQADWIRRMKKIGLYPLMTIKDGNIGKGGIVWAKDMSEALFKKISKESKKIRQQGKKIRVVINHADNLAAAEKLKKMLKEKIGAEVAFVDQGSPIICAGLGPGTLIVGYVPIR